jgi:opacity protein-like surface antigen
MNRTKIAMLGFTFALVTAFAAAASAMPSTGTLEVSGGYAKSSLEAAAPFSTDSPSGGLSFGAGYFRSIAPKTSWGIETSYDNLGHVDFTNVDSYTSSIHMLRVTPEFRMNFGAMVGPSFCAQAGAGYYNVSAKLADNTTSTDASASQGKIGFNMGAGVAFPMGPKTKMNIMGMYHSVSTTGSSTNYFGVRCGVGFGM